MDHSPLVGWSRSNLSKYFSGRESKQWCICSQLNVCETGLMLSSTLIQWSTLFTRPVDTFGSMLDKKDPIVPHNYLCNYHRIEGATNGGPHYSTFINSFPLYNYVLTIAGVLLSPILFSSYVSSSSYLYLEYITALISEREIASLSRSPLFAGLEDERLWLGAERLSKERPRRKDRRPNSRPNTLEEEKGSILFICTDDRSVTLKE